MVSYGTVSNHIIILTAKNYKENKATKKRYMIGILFLPIVIISVLCEEDHYFYANPLSKAINKMTTDLYLEILNPILTET